VNFVKDSKIGLFWQRPFGSATVFSWWLLG